MLSSQINHSSFFFSKINIYINNKPYLADEGDTVRHVLMKNQMPVCVQRCQSCKVFCNNVPILPCTTYIKSEMKISTKPKTNEPEVLRTMKMVADAPNFF